MCAFCVWTLEKCGSEMKRVVLMLLPLIAFMHALRLHILESHSLQILLNANTSIFRRHSATYFRSSGWHNSIVNSTCRSLCEMYCVAQFYIATHLHKEDTLLSNGRYKYIHIKECEMWCMWPIMCWKDVRNVNIVCEWYTCESVYYEDVHCTLVRYSNNYFSILIFRIWECTSSEPVLAFSILAHL